VSTNLVDLGTEPLLEPGEACALAGQVEAGVLARAARLDPTLPWRGDASTAELLLLEEQGEQARQRFIAANLRLVGLVVRSFSGRGGGSADLYQEGCLGLIAAVARFDHRRGTRFSTYALFWVRASVGAAAARAVGVAQLPTSRAEQLRAARGHEAELAQTLGRTPSVGELAASLGRTPSWTAALLAARPPQPLDAVDPATLDRAEAPATALGSGGSGWVRELLDDLAAEERRVIELRLGFAERDPCSRAEVARRLQQPVSRVRRIERRALERLRARCPQQAVDQL
jgi:RNA polymerase sigma factor (sigma-70 family)